MGQSLHGYIFGHYDSRGGTFMIIADNYDTALQQYEKAFGMTPEELAIYGVESSGLDEDYLGEAELEGIDDPSILDKDLDDIGRVLLQGEPEDVVCGFDNTTKPGPVKLLFEPKEHSAPLPEGYWHPNWNDDAYSFCVILPGTIPSCDRNYVE